MAPTTLILGSGRFIRAVLIPPLIEAGVDVHVYQPRGVSFCDSLTKGTSEEGHYLLNDVTYEVDTISFENVTSTDVIGAFL